MASAVYGVQSCRRRGLTILEVLIAVGVAIIGLFGVWALIPIAGQRVERALLEDEKSALGRSAFHDFDVRGMRDPENWLWQSDPNQPNRFVTITSATQGNSLGTPLPAPGFSFCIDPYLIADKKEAASPSAVRYFPDGVDPTMNPVMLRVTLRSQLNVPPANSRYSMNRQLARSIFETRDDINTNRQDDETLPALQQFSQLDPNDPNSTPYRRLADGALSWMATVTPTHGYFTDSYLLSIVVFHKREISEAMSDQEGVYDVVPASAGGFPGGGFGGGDIVVDANDTDLKQNDWVVLAQSGFANRFAWYRVVAADVDNNVTHVTLEGQDWNPVLPTKCIAVRNVAAVYEKTIRLETSSAWKTK